MGVLPRIAVLVAAGLFVGGCGGPAERAVDRPAAGGSIVPAVPGGGETDDGDLRTPRNATLGLSFKASGLPAGATATVGPFTNGDGVTLPAAGFTLYRAADVAVDLRQASYVRHSGQSPAEAPDALPRALLEWRDVAAEDATATGSLDNPAGDTWLWLDVYVGPRQAAGDYSGTITVGGVEREVAFRVLDFNLPDERRLTVAGRADWDDLKRLFPDAFETVQPRLIDREDRRYDVATGVLDALVSEAHDHRLALHVDALRPTVKWPSAEPPRVDWREFDALAGPWLDGIAFADRVPHGYWPLPEARMLDRYPPGAQLDYWQAAANHFDQNGWLDRSPLFVGGSGEPVGLDLNVRTRRRYNAVAATMLANHPSVRVQVPLELDQLELGDDADEIAEADAGRLVPASAGLVSDVPIETWPDGLDEPPTWLPTAGNALIPYTGAGGTLADVRSWAWLAFVRRSGLVDFGSALPQADSAAEAGDPNRLVWFYPGRWFGREGVVPSVQLKWLREAQQDHELLQLARERGETANARILAKLLPKPLQIRPLQEPEPSLVLMTGTADAAAWEEARRLVIDMILLKEPGELADPSERVYLERRQFRWMIDRERPVLMAGATEWLPGEVPGDLSLKLDVSIYNPTDTTPDENALTWTAVPRGWTVPPQSRPVPALAVYQVRDFVMTAGVDATATEPADEGGGVEITFVQGETGRSTPLRTAIPAADLGPLPGGLALDGDLSDWDARDRVQAGPMVAMLDRPTTQGHTLRRAEVPAGLWAGFTDENLYLAFELAGLTEGATTAGNVVLRDEDTGRAWGEDLAEVVVRPLYADGTLGPTVLIAFKPNGAAAGRSRLKDADAYTPFEGAIRYVAEVDGGTWRGEAAVDWSALLLPDRLDNLGQPERPAALLFNFGQHRPATGTTATWAGPVDHLESARFTGVLTLGEE